MLCIAYHAEMEARESILHMHECASRLHIHECDGFLFLSCYVLLMYVCMYVCVHAVMEARDSLSDLSNALHCLHQNAAFA
jgi:hypothetical protein